MNNIAFKVRGDGFYGSDDDFTLALTQDEDRCWFTLYGRSDGNNSRVNDDRVQFDFNDLTKGELEEIHCAVGLILESIEESTNEQ